MADGPLVPVSNLASRWELAAEAIAVKIRWFGLLVGYLVVNLHGYIPEHQAILNAILTLGAVYTLFDTYHSFQGRVLLNGHPLLISAMEALFIGLLCYYDRGLDSTFRYYYFLSIICCAIRYTPQVTYMTCALHCLSVGVLYFVQPGPRAVSGFIFAVIILGWVTWASNALALLLKQVGEYLGRLNTILKENQHQLEARIEERTQQLQESQAHVLHQEKMAAFGLLAAGIAHEVGNPLTSISTLVQMLQRRNNDEYVQEKLALVNGQLKRISGTLRQLVEFSRPASDEPTMVSLEHILDEALNVAKFYKRTGGRIISPLVPADLPHLWGVRNQLVQVFLNLILNALDAVSESSLSASVPLVKLDVDRRGEKVEVLVSDNGCGIEPAYQEMIFRPYFTTKEHGTGLGLFVTRKLVEGHGGTVSMTSTPGEGTTFRVLLPLAVDKYRDGPPAMECIDETVAHTS